MGRILGGTFALAAAALAACSSRHGGGAVPAAASPTPYAARPGFVQGLRLRPDTPSLTDEQAAERAASASVYADEETSYGPAGEEGRPWMPSDGWGTLPPGAGYAGPLGAVEPGLRVPSNTPILYPASPYRGPTDPPTVVERPATAGNDFFRRP